MWHLKKYLKKFPKLISTGSTKIYLSDEAYSSVKEPIISYLNGTPNSAITIIEQEPGRDVLLIKGKKDYILKFGEIEHWKKKLFNAWGIKKNGCFRHLTHEFINLCNINKLTDRAPTCHGFGYIRESGIMFGSEFLIIEYLDNTVMLGDVFIKEAYDEIQREKALKTAFRLIAKTIDQGFVHLDAHPGNILLNKNLEEGWLIDFENCSLSVHNRDLALASSSAQLFVRGLQREIPFVEKLFDATVESMVDEYNVKNKEFFLAAFRYLKNAGISRKRRNRTFSITSYNQKMVDEISKTMSTST